MYFGQRLVALLTVGLAPVASLAGEPLPRSVLILDQSDVHSAWYTAFSSAFRSTMNPAGSAAQISIYAEHLDLSRFGSAEHDEVLRTYLRDKFRDRPIGVLVAQGSSSLEFVVRSRAQLWSGVPVVFAGVDEETTSRLHLPSGVTGTIYQLPFRNTVTAARALVPNLKRIALVGDAWERQAVRRHYKDDIPAFAAQFEFIDLIGLPMAEIRKRTAVLPDDTAIIYTSVTLDGAGATYIPHEGLAAFADVANRPIVVDAETNIGRGGTGGFVATPVPVGQAAARLAFRILSGESASQIPITKGDYTKPVFDWRELKRWNISEAGLPPGSEIRYRQPSLWNEYRWHVTAAFAVVLIQAALISWLLFERLGRRRAAEQMGRARAETGQYRDNLAHLMRVHTVGEMSTGIAHEINQPLAAIKNYALAARQRLAGGGAVDAVKVEELLDKIGAQASRAGDVLHSLRGMVKKHQSERTRIEVGRLVTDALKLVEMDGRTGNIRVESTIAPDLPLVFVDGIQIQQVVLNLTRNAIEAMEEAGIAGCGIKVGVVGTAENEIAVSVADCGPGIAPGDAERIFDPFYSTKGAGLGVGLSISRAIVEAHGGRLSLTRNTGGGCVFQFTLPVVSEGS
jgi:signal transduction histidine kinase